MPDTQPQSSADPLSSMFATVGIGDLLGMFGGSNPFAGLGRSFTQFQRGVGQFMESVEKFNTTMDELHGVATRLNNLLDTVEEPVRAVVPQVTRTARAADALVEQLSGPVERLIPALADLTQRLQPVAQLAESAGGWFGLRPLAALRSGGGSARTVPAPQPSAPVPEIEPHHKPAAKKTAAKKTAAKKTAAKKAAGKKTTGKTTTGPKKAAAKKAAAR